MLESREGLVENSLNDRGASVSQQCDPSTAVQDYSTLSATAVEHKAESDRHAARRVLMLAGGFIPFSVISTLVGSLYNVSTALAVSSGAGTAAGVTAGAKVLGGASIAASLGFFSTASIAVSGIVLGLITFNAIAGRRGLSGIGMFNKFSRQNRLAADAFDFNKIDNKFLKGAYRCVNILDEPLIKAKEPDQKGWSFNALVSVGSVAVALGAFAVAILPVVVPAVAIAMPAAVASAALSVLVYSLGAALSLAALGPAVSTANFVMQLLVLGHKRAKDHALCKQLDAGYGKGRLALTGHDVLDDREYQTTIVRVFGIALKDASRSSTCRRVLAEAAKTLMETVKVDPQMSDDEKSKFVDKIKAIQNEYEEPMNRPKGQGTAADDFVNAHTKRKEAEAKFDQLHAETHGQVIARVNRPKGQGTAAAHTKRKEAEAKFDQLHAQTPVHVRARDTQADQSGEEMNPLSAEAQDASLDEEIDFDKLDRELDQTMQELSDDLNTSTGRASPPADLAPDSPRSSSNSEASQESGSLRAADTVQKFQTRTDAAVHQQEESSREEGQTPSSLRP